MLFIGHKGYVLSSNFLNQIIHADCFDVIPHIPSKSVDLIFTDMPYGTTKNQWDKVPDLPKLWTHYERIIKDNGAIVLFAQSPFDKILAVSNLKLYRYEWIWEKTTATGFLNSKKMPLKAHENLLVFYKKLPIYNPAKTKSHKKESSKASQEKGLKSNNYGKNYCRVDYCSDERYPRSVLRFSTDKQKGQIHPTQKPVSLCEYIIKTYTNPDGIVLDTFAGSGTIPVASINTGRNFIAVEGNIKHFFDAKARINDVFALKQSAQNLTKLQISRKITTH